jgi:hypothetical protein
VILLEQALYRKFSFQNIVEQVDKSPMGKIFLFVVLKEIKKPIKKRKEKTIID